MVNDMRILYEDDHRNLVAMECSSMGAINDGDSGWAVVATEVGVAEGHIVRSGLSEADAKRIVRVLFDTGRYCP